MNQKFYDTIARFYDAENAEMTDDLPLYRELAAACGDPVLDVGCGTGRVMLHLARAGHTVVGVDHSAAMLARGQHKLDALDDKKKDDVQRRVTWVQGDVLTAELPGPFNLIVVPYNGFMHFHHQAEQQHALRRFKELLAPEGQIVLDLPNAGEAFASQDDNAVSLERTFVEPDSGHLVLQQSVSELNRVTQQMHITWLYDEIAADGTLKRTVSPLVLRYVFGAELDLLLAAAGLQRREVFGDYWDGPFEDGSPRMIVVAGHVEAEST
ncbi:MAG: class I SAM-dependent methyltransferase [Chloroflexi bacterium]|nr:class I SAM-dependent methyltransferase [Chloroflexota bacterium]